MSRKLEFIFSVPEEILQLAEKNDVALWKGICLNLFDLGEVCNEAAYHATLTGDLRDRLEYKQHRYRIPFKAIP